MKTKLFIPLLLILCMSILVAESFDKTLVIRTNYFDIIYPPKSAETAALLAEYADGFADEICGLLETSMKERIPVYLDPNEEVTNAYYSSAYYSHIVLYDTVPLEGRLGVFRDNILMIFYHELTHAISLTIQTPFWQVMSRIFGDYLSINQIVTMPLSFVEGVTVSFESRSGEGRLNDPLTDHFLIEDKYENKFCSWADAAGARDVYPGGTTSYLYGGAFSAWLQKTYGMEKYAELWRLGGGVSLFHFSVSGRFKQVYGIGLDDAWDEFRDSIVVPDDIKENPATLSEAGDGICSALASGPNGIAWYDGNACAVKFRDSVGNVTSLFDADSSLHRLSFSPDGKLLLVSAAAISGKAIRQQVRVYDMQRHRFLAESWPGLRDASFFGDSNTVCGIEAVAQKSTLVVFSRDAPENKKTVLTAGPGESFYTL